MMLLPRTIEKTDRREKRFMDEMGERRETRKGRWTKKRICLVIVGGILTGVVACFLAVRISHREDHSEKTEVIESAETIESADVTEAQIRSDDPFWVAVRENFDIETEELTKETVLSADSLVLQYIGDMDLSPLRYFDDLKSLSLSFDSDNEEKPELSVVGELTGLEILDVSNYPIGNDTEFLTRLSSLKELYLVRCGITDIGFVAKLPNLTHVSFYGNEIRDVAPLGSCTELCELSLAYNSIEDITPLKNLTKMENLGLQNNHILDIAPLKELDKLTKLNVSANGISDLAPISGRTKMTDFGASDNYIEDLTPLKNMKKLKNLALDGNRIKDISPIAGAVDMQYLGLSLNDIEDMSPIWGMTQLYYLSIGDNPSSNIRERIVTPQTYYGSSLRQRMPEKWEENRKEAERIFRELLPEYADEETEVEDYLWGDLNGDGRDDLALTCRNNMWTDEGDVYDVTRKVFVLLAKDKAYEPLSPIDTMGPDSGGIYGDPYMGIYCVDGQLVINNYGGSNFRWDVTDIYRYNGKEMEQIWSLSLDNYVFTSGADWHIEDMQTGFSAKYAIAGEWEGDKNILLLYSSEEEKKEKRREQERDSLFQEIQEKWGMDLPQLYSGDYLPNVDDDGYYVYHYYETLAEFSKSPEELLEEAATDYLEEAVRLPIEIYASEEIKDSYDHLAGVALPSDFYIGKMDGEVRMLVYQGYRTEEEDIVHKFIMQKPSKDGERWRDEEVILYREATGTWEKM